MKNHNTNSQLNLAKTLSVHLTCFRAPPQIVPGSMCYRPQSNSGPYYSTCGEVPNYCIVPRRHIHSVGHDPYFLECWQHSRVCAYLPHTAGSGTPAPVRDSSSSSIPGSVSNSLHQYDIDRSLGLNFHMSTSGKLITSLHACATPIP